jgi:Flp pilus assembly protein TadD
MGLDYEVARRDGKVFHSETQRDEQGRVVASVEAEVAYAIGSGRQGLSYLIERDGRVFQSPISWYARAGKWGLSPGYEGGNLHFERPVEPACLFCHSNRVEPVTGTINAYRAPTFRGLAIGCERCHGPGELHVRGPGPVGGGDPKIVNPRRLEPLLRESVCEQCHLKGRVRVEPFGVRADGYRPGLPLDAFLRVFVEPRRATGAGRSVGHVEQMHASRCFRESRGRLGCISCHDPHRLPRPGERVSHFRDRCLECHDGGHGCGMAEGRRRERNPEDSCIECHMPRSPLADIPHVAATDHTIPRLAGVDGSIPPPLDDQEVEKEPLVPWAREGRAPRDRADFGRDLGLALSEAGQELRGMLGPQLARRSLPLLQASLEARPNDVAAREAQGLSLALLGRSAEAFAALEATLALDPVRERVLAATTAQAARLGRHEEALALARRTLDVNPWVSDYHLRMAALLAQRGEWRPAIDACLSALHLNPANLSVRRLLITCYLRQGDTTRARAECRTLIGFDPPDRPQLERWLAGSR